MHSDALYFAEPKNDTIGPLAPHDEPDEDFITGRGEPKSYAPLMRNSLQLTLR